MVIGRRERWDQCGYLLFVKQKKEKKRKCTKINQDQRCNIFKHFWPLSWSEKTVYIRAHAKKTKTKQLTVKERKESRRSDTLKIIQVQQ